MGSRTGLHRESTFEKSKNNQTPPPKKNPVNGASHMAEEVKPPAANPEDQD